MTRISLKTVEEITQAVDAGYNVYADTLAYVVFKDDAGQYRIMCPYNGYTIDLSGRVGTGYAQVLNARNFFVIEQEDTQK